MDQQGKGPALPHLEREVQGQPPKVPLPVRSEVDFSRPPSLWTALLSCPGMVHGLLSQVLQPVRGRASSFTCHRRLGVAEMGVGWRENVPANHAIPYPARGNASSPTCHIKEDVGRGYFSDTHTTSGLMRCGGQETVLPLWGPIFPTAPERGGANSAQPSDIYMSSGGNADKAHPSL